MDFVASTCFNGLLQRCDCSHGLYAYQSSIVTNSSKTSSAQSATACPSPAEEEPENRPYTDQSEAKEHGN
jgi:hypothetical protein